MSKMVKKGGWLDSFKKFDRTRWWTHAALLLLTVVSYFLSYLYNADFTFTEAMTFGPGYLALLLTAISLIIGPLRLLVKPKNPVNINLRRDVGIWAGLTAAIHVIFGFQLQFGGDILRYFFADGKLLTNLFGLSNDVGLVAALLMLALLVFSNDLSLRKLKGKRWKLIQRFNYLLFALAVLHTVGYQVYGERGRIFVLSSVAIAALVMAAQAFGMYLYLRNQEAKLARAGVNPATVATGPDAAALSVSRRRFLTLTGTAMLTAGVGGFVLGRVVMAGHEETAVEARPVEPNTPDPTSTPNPTNTPVPNNGGAFGGNNSGRPFDGNNGTGRRGGQGNFQRPVPGGTGNNTAPGVGGTGSNTAPNAGGTGNNTAPNGGTTTQAPSSGSGSTKGTIITTLAALPIGQAMKFINPVTQESSVLIHETDGAVKAFSNVCTHRPYELTYDGPDRGLYCALHSVYFDAKSGAPKSRPANRALKSFNVQVDAQGNIVYIS